MHTASNGLLPLSMVGTGQKVRLVEISAGTKLRRRLTELGLTPGVELQVMQDQGGPLLLSVYNSRLAVGRGMAHKIMVEPITEQPHTNGNNGVDVSASKTARGLGFLSQLFMVKG